jgi:hypothetical protein
MEYKGHEPGVSIFAFVHGAWHGAWCWERLTPLPRERGYEVIVADLPCSDGAQTYTTYAESVLQTLEGATGEKI